jgi:molybdopterin/thiamine biosynthesis adenylyltransferase
LDGPGATLATRTRQGDSNRKSWDLQLDHALVGQQRVSIYLTQDFPATPPQVVFDKSLCLRLPHIEEDGRFCHGVEPAPSDYDIPSAALVAVLEKVRQFWADSQDVQWVSDEFDNEALSYWRRFCDQCKPVRGATAPSDVRVALGNLDGPTDGRSAAYFTKKNQNARSQLIVASVGEVDPHSIAVRHGWSAGTLVRGHVLFVPIAPKQRWTPGDWPTTLPELESLVAQATDHALSVSHWINATYRESRHAFLVVLVQGTTCYGYLVYPAPVARLTFPSVMPVVVDRVDADWALARDHALPALHGRRGKRVLVLGCGSLGAPVAELLARAGVGELHLLDKELFEPENCARHLLGARDIGLSKVRQMAERLRHQVPGANIKHFHAPAAEWVRKECKPGTYDLVVDCTGESAVRVMLAHYREISLGKIPLVHAWIEHFCAAAHVVYLRPGDGWPVDDPYRKVNVANWPEDTRVNLPACNAGFHPYGVADAWQAAGFTAERLLAGLDGQVAESVVWSWVRSSAFFQALPVRVEPGPLVPSGASPFDSCQLARTYRQVFGDG